MVKIALRHYQLTPLEIIYYISLACSIPFYLEMKYNKKEFLKVSPKMYVSLVVRIFCGFLADVFLFYAFNFTSYSKALCLFFTNPILIPFISKCITKSRIRKFDIIAFIIGFCGLLMIINPVK